jgi:uncharacterized protein (TIGR02594 family)
MAITRIITDIPDDQIAFVVGDIEVDGGRVVRQMREGDGTTIVAEFEKLVSAAEFSAENAAEFPWMKIARQELGQVEVSGSGSNPRIEQYHATTRLGSKTDSVPWCSSFVNFCLKTSGLSGTDSALARSWLSWGIEAPSLVPGCIVVLERGQPPKGHVGFYVGRDGQRIQLLGGNQGDAVSIASFDSRRIIGKRMPDKQG